MGLFCTTYVHVGLIYGEPTGLLRRVPRLKPISPFGVPSYGCVLLYFLLLFVNLKGQCLLKYFTTELNLYLDILGLIFSGY